MQLQYNILVIDMYKYFWVLLEKLVQKNKGLTLKMILT